MIISISGKIGSGKDTTGKIIQILLECPHFNNEPIKNFLNRDLPKPLFTIEKWAGNLKDITCLLINCTREELEDEEFKNKELGRDWRQYFIIDKNGHRVNTIKYLSEIEVQEELERLNHSKLNYDYSFLTPRLLLQLLGTECGRNIIHPNIWVNSLMSKYKFSVKPGTPDYPNWIITDTRFPNELEAIKKRDGISIRINREIKHQIEALGGKTDVPKGYFPTNQHPSETALDNATFDYTINNNGTLDELIDKIREILIKLKLI